MTELLGTDLHRLITSRPLEKQFIQYFLYQILVSFKHFDQKPKTWSYGANMEESTKSRGRKTNVLQTLM